MREVKDKTLRRVRKPGGCSINKGVVGYASLENYRHDIA